MEFDIPKEYTSIIKVIGVGGGGSNAVNHMFNQGFKGVDFIVCNTDKQSLDASPVPLKIQLGPSLTEGRGAGSIPEIGMNAAIENIDEVRELLAKDTKMVFITAGMGGGTGTGAAPVIAKVARELGILTVGIVTVPFNFEGRKRRQQAEQGLENIREAVDTLVVINNERLREISGNLTIGNAFAQADDVLATAAKGISDVISATGSINVDFNDVNTVMKDSGVAVMGSAVAVGENRAIEAVQNALASPLLNDNDIEGAEYVLLNITYGEKEVLMDEISDITDYIQDEAGSTADVIWGHGYDETLGEGLSVTIIATGFKKSPVTGFEKAPERKVQVLDETPKKEIVEPLETAVPKNEYKETEIEEPYMKTFEEMEEVEEEVIEDSSSQTSFDWEIKPAIEMNETMETSSEFVEQPVENEEVKRYFLEDDIEVEVSSSSANEPKPLSHEDMKRRMEERMERIRDYTAHLNSAEGLSELEKEPAFKRRNIEIENKEFSTEENHSRFEAQNDGNKTTLRDSNSYLHDNVD